MGDLEKKPSYGQFKEGGRRLLFISKNYELYKEVEDFFHEYWSHGWGRQGSGKLYVVIGCVRWGRRENLSQQGHDGGRIFPCKSVMSLAGTGRRVLLLINLLGLVKIER